MRFTHVIEVVEAMRSSTPGWLYAALDEALVEAGATAAPDVRRQVVDKLIAAWNMDGRSYHNCRYLGAVLERLDELEGVASKPELLRLAAAFRGALEEPGWEESEDQRAPAAVPPIVSLSDLTDLGIPKTNAARIRALITQLSEHSPEEGDFEAALLIDADLATLATPPQQYREFLTHFRAEAPHMSEIDFLRARRFVLRRLLARPQIFATPLASQWEDAARDNLEAELSALQSKLKRLKDSDSEAVSDPEETSSFSGEKSSRPPSRDSRVLRISRAQKADRLDKVQSSQASTDPRLETTSSKTPMTAPEDVEEPGDGGYVSDTSTLESVADLIENHRPRGKRAR